MPKITKLASMYALVPSLVIPVQLVAMELLTSCLHSQLRYKTGMPKFVTAYPCGFWGLD